MAERLGVVHVERDILRGLTAAEFRGWQHYCEIVPSESMKQDWRNASLKHMIYLVNRSKKSKDIPLKDFVLQWVMEETRSERQTPDQQWKMVNALAAMHANDGPKFPKVIDDGVTMISAPPPNDGPGEVGPIPSNLVLPPDVQAALEKARAAMKKT